MIKTPSKSNCSNEIKLPEYLKKRQWSDIPSSELENTKYLSASNSWIHNQIRNFTFTHQAQRAMKNLIQDKGVLNTVLETL